ncbi:DUF1064 domain-containing protein [Apilactobacillus timberlakei]|uniref:DUF1064 domain-containing protein n=1 Tax=Apilactobacillus timberlakei TaxID=2008380 RepID=A0ABY2YRG7_9LACO|nr:DUF1064 domain-containing protein [Apilactobacillus timberlakei]TPR12762.1 DUF1064 domain-containing protein [Apilactobacillus timberlakei]TPR13645.1 DUF1064 domain-containing protein [Apilactobacillus timberlakei]
MINYPNTNRQFNYKRKIVRPRRKRNKYQAHKVTVDGHKFDSRVEANYYKLLKQQHTDFKLHERFELLPTLRIFGKTYSKRVYTPDFTIYEHGELVEAIDVKGYKITADASLRMRAFIEKYRVPVYIVRNKNNYEKELF